MGVLVFRSQSKEADWVTKSPVRHKLYRVLLTDLAETFRFQLQVFHVRNRLRAQKKKITTLVESFTRHI